MKALLFVISFLSIHAIACTTFQVRNSEEKLVAKGFDWNQSHGMVVVNQRRMAKESLAVKETDRVTRWTSTYGSVTLNQYGREFPLSGMNERGLVVEIMWAGSGQPAADDRGTLNELQWIQYQLDNYATVEEVIRHVPDVRISWVYANVHYLVCDATGSCGTVDIDSGNVVTHSGAQMAVNTLTNDLYSESVAQLRRYTGFGGTLPIPMGDGSFERFVRVSDLVRRYQPSATAMNVGWAFSVIEGVRQDSMWHVVYNVRDRAISWKTRDRRQEKTINARDFNFACSSAEPNPRPVKALDMNLLAQGDVTDRLGNYSDADNRVMVEAALRDKLDVLPPGVVDLVSRFPSGRTRCVDR